jgi:hypothetical protein
LVPGFLHHCTLLATLAKQLKYDAIRDDQGEHDPPDDSS